MTKKEYVLKFLSVLEPSWEPAKAMKILVAQDFLADEVIDAMIRVFSTILHTQHDVTQKQKLTKSLQFLEQLKKTELSHDKQNQSELATLDQLISQL